MSLWEYKVITSGKGGFATPALLEKFLNDLGRDEWEIIHFQTPPDNFLAFTGLVRRSTQRDWTLEDAAAAAAKAEAEKLRAEFEAKFKAASSPAPAGGAEERAPSFLEEKSGPDDGFRKLVDTSRDDEPEAAEDEKDDWDKLTAAEEDELPTFFDAIKPHMRRNQRGPGMSVGVDYLAKKWDQSEEDLKGALEECGFVVPADEDSKAEYLEYDGDLYWLNINRRGELWINTKEKPRPVFRAVKAARIEIETPAKDENRGGEARGGEEKSGGGEAGGDAPKSEGSETRENRGGKSDTPPQPLPEGTALLDKIRPHMRRNRRGPGGSGSASFLSRALRTNETELRAAFAALGLTLPASPNDKPVYTEIGNDLWWLNLDSRGGLWINGREKRSGETAASANATPSETPAEGGPAPANADSSAPAAASPTADTPVAPAETIPDPVPAATADLVAGNPVPAAPASAPETGAAVHPTLTVLRPLLKDTRNGVAGKLDRLAEETSKSVDELTASLLAAGLKLPEKPREKPVHLEQGGEVYWLSVNAKGELWLNARGAKAPDKDGDDAEGEDKPRRGRAKKSEGDAASETDSPPADAGSI